MTTDAFPAHDCEVCQEQWRSALPADASVVLRIYRSFIVCPDCGNKRCPKATHHTHECSGSNETGQNGSSWGTLWPCDKVL